MFYPDCGFGILKTASPNPGLRNISKHLLSSAYPRTSLQPALSVSHLPDTWQALSLWKQEQSVPLPGNLQNPPPSPPCFPPGSRHPRLCRSQCFAFVAVGVMSVLPGLFTNQFLPPIPRQLFQNENTGLGSGFLPSSRRQLTVKVLCPSGNSSPLSWNLRSWKEGGGMRKHQQTPSNSWSAPAACWRDWLLRLAVSTQPNECRMDF